MSESVGDQLLLLCRVRRRDRVAFADAVPVPPPTHRSGCPPVRITEQLHRRRDQQRANDGGIDQQRDEHADTDQLHEDQAGRAEGSDDHCQQQCGAGDDPTGLLYPGRHGERVVAGAVPLLADPGEQEHLVVHRQPEQDREHQDRLGGVEEPGDSKPNRFSRWPSAKIQVTTPNDAVIDTAFISTALSGSTIDPNARNRRISITPTTMRPIHGRWSPTDPSRSTLSAVSPPTRAFASPGGTTSRRSRTRSWEKPDWLLPSQNTRNSDVEPDRSTGCTSTTPSRAVTSSTYDVASRRSASVSMMFAVDVSGPKSVFSLSAATCAEASCGSTR